MTSVRVRDYFICPQSGRSTRTFPGFQLYLVHHLMRQVFLWRSVSGQHYIENVKRFSSVPDLFIARQHSCDPIDVVPFEYNTLPPSSKHFGDGFGNRSYLMVHLPTLATYWFDFRQKTIPLPYSIHLRTEDVSSMCTVKYVLVQTYKCGSIVNPRQLNDAKLSRQFIYTMNHVPFQMCKCCLIMLLRQLILRQALHNLSTTFQKCKCDLKVRQTTTSECFDD